MKRRGLRKKYSDVLLQQESLLLAVRFRLRLNTTCRGSFYRQRQPQKSPPHLVMSLITSRGHQLHPPQPPQPPVFVATTIGSHRCTTQQHTKTTTVHHINLSANQHHHQHQQSTTKIRIPPTTSSTTINLQF